jgi:replicative DNA helicase
MENFDQTQAAILGTLILYPDRTGEVAEATCPEWFTGNYRKAFAYLVENNGADVTSIAAATGIAMAEVVEWTGAEFSTSFLKQHIANLEKEANIRKVRYLGQQLSKTDDVEESMKLIERFGKSFDSMDKTEPVTIKKGLRLFADALEKRYRRGGVIQGMSYGIPDLDFMTEGMNKGDLVIVAAPSSMGKTSFAVGAAESAAFLGHKVLIFSCEMTTEQLLMRSISAHADIYLSKIRSAKLDDKDWAKIEDSVAVLSKCHIDIDDPAGITLSELSRKAKKVKKKKGLDLILIDYLQIMRYDKGREVQELDDITTGLKHLAKELDVCIVLLSQLNRGSEKEKRKPSMTDLRGSGMIENNADVILFPWRPAANCPKCMEKIETPAHSTKSHQSEAEIIIGKQRQGERNVSVPAVWVGSKTRFIGMGE